MDSNGADDLMASLERVVAIASMAFNISVESVEHLTAL